MSFRFFLTALALAPTAEKELIDIQRKACTLSPSALALPPLRPLFLGTALPLPENLAAFRRTGGAAFRLTGYGQRKNILFAAMPPEAFPGVQTFFAPAARPAGETNENSAAPEGFAALTGMEGFYIADLSGTQSSCFPLEELPRLPAFTLRTLRLLTLEIHLSPAAPWWHAVEWTILSESWLKLKS